MRIRRNPLAALFVVAPILCSNAITSRIPGMGPEGLVVAHLPLWVRLSCLSSGDALEGMREQVKFGMEE
ncbi:MAG: hypothetical protein GY696_27655 [Gammaproteobacteria bacterium]|nr:hypothetical protein [Gammaproteobacteria bacterium]